MKSSPFTTSTTIMALLLIAVAPLLPGVDGFSAALFQQAPTQQRTTPSKLEGVDIELPDFDELFGRIQKVSPLARVVMAGDNMLPDARGLAAVDDTWPGDLQWKLVESKPKQVIHSIEKIDNFNGVNAPLLRMRAHMTGPCVAEYFANFMTCYDQRKRWDPNIAQVYESHPIHDLDAANIAMGFGQYGDCSRLGVGYCQTKKNMVVDAREQLTLCGMQNYKDGSAVFWAIEMEDWHNHMLPPGKRHTRARTHIFSTTFCPTGENSFDVEYVIQLDIGGKIPSWATAPIVIETCKGLFRSADQYFRGKDGELEAFLESKEKEDMANRHSLLMTP